MPFLLAFHRSCAVVVLLLRSLVVALHIFTSEPHLNIMIVWCSWGWVSQATTTRGCYHNYDKWWSCVHHSLWQIPSRTSVKTQIMIINTDTHKNKTRKGYQTKYFSKYWIALYAMVKRDECKNAQIYSWNGCVPVICIIKVLFEQETTYKTAEWKSNKS